MTPTRRSLLTEYKIFSAIATLIIAIALVQQLVSEYQFFNKHHDLLFKAEAERVEYVVNDVLQYVEHFGYFLGSRIAEHAEPHNKEYLDDLLAAATTLAHEQKPFTWTGADFILPNGKIIASSKEASNEEQQYNFIHTVKKHPWKLHFGSPTENTASVLPTALGITEAATGEFLGVVAIGVNIPGLSQKISESLTNKDTIFLILNKAMQPIGYSDLSLLTIKREKLAQLSALFTHPNGYITEQDNIDKIKFFYYKKIDHDLTILVGKSEEVIIHELNQLLITTLKLPLLIFISFLVILYIFSNTVLAPFKTLSEVAFNIAKGHSTGTVPKFYNDEALNLSKALMLVHQALKGEQESKIALLQAKQELQDMNNQLEQKVHQRTAELEKSLRLNTNFLNNISHEVRIPIQGITALSRGLIDNWDNFDASARYHLAMKIANNSGRLFSLVSHLLDLSKVTSEQVKLQAESADLVVITKEVIEEFNSLYLMDNRITIELQSPESLILIFDSQKITQILRNLLSNAVKAMADGGIITITIEAYGGNANITITDQGCGIAAGDLENIFEPFVQSRNAGRNGGGVGLGLAIVNALIKAHNGTISAKNNQDKGASFTFTIPLSPTNLLTKSALQQVETSKVTIVFVDDEATCLLSVEILLRNTDYHLHCFDRPKKALEFLQTTKETIDIIMLDMMMPEMTGLELLTIIKSDKKLQHIPVIIQSGIADEHEIEAARQVGMAHFMSKPYSKDDIIQIIEEIMNEDKDE